MMHSAPPFCDSFRPVRGVTVFAALALVLIHSTAFAQSKSDPTKLTAEERLKVFQASVADLQIVVADKPEPLKLHDAPLMRFTNEAGGVVDGAVMLWKDGDRPMVAAQVFVVRDGVWIHEFQSFADRPLKATQKGKTLWQPKSAGGRWRDVKSDPEIANSRAGRLLQLKQLSTAFSVGEDFRNQPSDANTTRYELRLLPAPIYRYEETEQGVDGAVFAFVHGTDPEALLTIEMNSNQKPPSVRYNFAALTCWALQAKQGEETTWTVPEMFGKSAIDQPYHVWVFTPNLAAAKK